MENYAFFINDTRYPTPKISFGKDTFGKINQVVCDYYNVTLEQLISKDRTRPVIFARQLAIALAYVNCVHMSCKYIGAFYGKKDHTTVLHCIDQLIDKKDSPCDDPLKIGYHDVVALLPFESKEVKKRYDHAYPKKSVHGHA
jgi:hypothetical protein